MRRHDAPTRTPVCDDRSGSDAGRRVCFPRAECQRSISLDRRADIAADLCRARGPTRNTGRARMKGLPARLLSEVADLLERLDRASTTVQEAIEELARATLETGQ